MDGAKLPNGDRAVVDIAKLRDYCLSPTHPEGRHKARVFRSALGFTAENAGILRERLLEAARTESVADGGLDDYGKRYIIDVRLQNESFTAAVRTTWIIRKNEDFPRLTSCFVL